MTGLSQFAAAEKVFTIKEGATCSNSSGTIRYVEGKIIGGPRPPKGMVIAWETLTYKGNEIDKSVHKADMVPTEMERSITFETKETKLLDDTEKATKPSGWIIEAKKMKITAAKGKTVFSDSTKLSHEEFVICTTYYQNVPRP